MAPTHRPRTHLWLGAASVLALVASPLAGTAAAATNGSTDSKISFDRLAYNINMRSGAIEFFAEVPRETQQDIGYSRVRLAKDADETASQCRVEAGGYYLGEEVEEGVIKGGAAPVADGQDEKDASPYENPTYSRKQRPEISTGVSANDRVPVTPASGNGPLFSTECLNDNTAGKSVGDVVNAGGARIAGSTSEASLDKESGNYRAVGRAYVSGLDGAFDTMTSLMEVSLKPATIGEEPAPVISWRMSFFNSDPASSGFTSESFSIGGSDVPASDFVDQFNSQSEAFAKAAEPLGPAGLRILEPAVYPDQDTGRMTITAPSAYGNLGFASRAGTIGDNQGARFTSITWTGDLVFVPK